MASYIKYKLVIRNFEILNIDNELVNEGKISYNKDLPVNAEIVSIHITLEGIENEKNIFSIEINSEKDLNQERLTAIANKLVDDLLNKIAFYYIGATVGEPWIISSSFEDENKKRSTSEVPSSIFVSTESRDKESIESICKAIERGDDFSQNDYRIFRAAMNNEDIVAKYMFLYQMLSLKLLNNKEQESQKSVDKFIISKVDENQHQYQRWIDTNRDETIYTRLRNQVGHNRGKMPEETREAMEGKINELINLVKISISET